MTYLSLTRYDIKYNKQNDPNYLFLPYAHSLQSETVRNIGVTIDSDFNFRKHISLTCRRIYRYICLLQSPKVLL